MNKTAKYIVSPKSPIREVMKIIDENKDGIVLVANEEGRLVGTVTDGDIRRFMPPGRPFDEPSSSVMWINPATVPLGASRAEIREVLARNRLRSIPVVDLEGRPCDLVHLRDFLPSEDGDPMAVIMAGGEGKRLRPLTESIPKPMAKIGDRPILENIVRNLEKAGIKKLYLTVNYQAEAIEGHFGDGNQFGVSINYLREKVKMGTAGGLSLLPEIPHEPFIVMNGDLLTTVNFNRMFDFHRQHRSVLTIAASEYHLGIPYGVLDLAGHFVLGVNEKPTKSVFCNSGIYILNPELLRLIPNNAHYNMTDLMRDVVREGLPMAAFPLHEYWVDIGQKEDLHKAREDFQNGVVEYE